MIWETNPYAYYGSIVYGADFVDRTEEQGTLQSRIITAAEPGCTSIVGAPKIGKSSLAYHALCHQSDRFLLRGLIVRWLNIATIRSLEDLFKALVRSSLGVLEDHAMVEIEPRNIALQLLGQRLDWADLQNEVQRYFTAIRRAGWRVVFVLDEFDTARSLFNHDALGFHALRSLNDNPDWRVTFVTLSRRSLSEIEAQSRADISNFHNIFHSITLAPFNRLELLELLARFETISRRLNDDEVEFFVRATGGHPFLASILAFQAAELWINYGDLSLDRALDRSQSMFIDYYDQLIDLLQEEGTLEKLMQILFGPVTTVTGVDVDRFVRYGLLHRQNEDRLVSFSSHFEEYLELRSRRIDLWPLWRDTERLLRVVIASKLQAAYGDTDWIEQLIRTRPKLKSMVEGCQARQANEQRKFGERASINLLDFTYPGDLYQLINSHWHVFQPLLGHNEGYWAQCFNVLSSVRAPYAHNRDEVLAAHERQLAEAYCQEIIHRLKDNAIDA